LIGKNIFALYPHQSRFTRDAERAIVLPDYIPPQRAVLAANLETAINATWDAAPRVGDRISVVGAGVVGCLVAFLCAGVTGTDVQLVDVKHDRARIARVLGARFALPAEADCGRDLVFHASATSDGLNNALALAGREAEVIEMSWFGTRSVTLDLGARFHSERLAIRASQVGTVAPARAARWSFHRRLALAVSLCADARLDALFAPDVPFDTLPQVMARLADPADRTLCQRIDYSGET
jgi:threonine dehydrogenase-like Zn-dependent dehydrogenase